MELLNDIVRLATTHRLVLLTYQKPQDASTTKRMVEPYVLLENGANLMIRCWQVDPETGGSEAWRTFRVDRIRGVEEAGVDFAPRRPITLSTGEVQQFKMDRRDWTADPMNRYREVVEAAVIDGKLSPKDIERAFEASRELSVHQKRAVHGRIYAATLAECALDGEIDDREVKFIKRLHRFLKTLGWAP